MKTFLFILLLPSLVVIFLVTPAGHTVLMRAGQWLVVTTPVHRADVIVALGGDRARQEKAAELYRQGLAPFVLFTGADARNRDYGCLGIPPEAALAVPRPVFTTNAEGDTVREIVDKNRYRSILLVTSPYHSRRALAVFQKEFRGKPVEVLLTTCDPPAFLDHVWWRSHMGVKTILTEYFGMSYYWLKGFV